jgi:hypothetical protein
MEMEPEDGAEGDLSRTNVQYVISSSADNDE